MNALLEEVRTAKRLRSPQVAKAIRLGAGVSLRRLAIEVGVSPAALLAWEEGRYKPRGSNRVIYIDLLEALSREVSA